MKNGLATCPCRLRRGVAAASAFLFLALLRCGGQPAASSSPLDAAAGDDLIATPQGPPDAASPDAVIDGGNPAAQPGDAEGGPGASDASLDAASPPINYAVWGFAANDVWVGDDTGVMTHWDGTVFHPFSTTAPASVRSIWGASTNDVWAAAEYEMLHWDGAHLTAVSVPTQLLFVTAVSGSAASDVWAVGQAGVAVHWDGHTWTSYPTGINSSMDLESVWVKSPTEAYAVGGFSSPAMIKWNGSTWAPFPIGGVDTGLTSVWGSSPSDLWIGGWTGVFHFDGSQWATTPAPLAGQPFWHLWGRGPGDVWAVGGSAGTGLAFHNDGAHWSTVDVGRADSLRSVWSAGGAGNTWFVGDVGTLVRR